MNATRYTYWHHIQKLLPRLLLVSLAAAVVAWVVVSRIGATHEIHFSYLVSLSKRDAASDYRFDGYYALQATDLFSETIAELIASPETIAAALARAGLGVGGTSRQLSQVIVAEKKAPQLVHVVIRQPSQDNTQRLYEALQQVVREAVTQYHDEGVPEIEFSVVATQPWSTVTQWDRTVVATVVFLVVLCISCNLIVLRESVRRLTAS